MAVIGRGNVIQLLWKGMMVKSVLCYSFPVKDKTVFFYSWYSLESLAHDYLFSVCVHVKSETNL